ncbi:permease [Planctomycetales bacterium]|nr:permease [Planctomycetales bacterium]GHT06373.1 permease [Planctomycetales bacterium]
MTTWFLPVLISAVFLGFYSLSVKHAVRGNALMPVLFYATLCGSGFYVAGLLAGGRWREVVAVDFAIPALVLIKSLLVATSFIGVYYGLRELPISIAAPIRSSSPLWTFFGGVALYNEVPTLGQAAAAAVIFGGYALFSLLGSREGISFARHRGLHLLAGGTLLAAGSTLYNKFLITVALVPRETMQFWYAVELVTALGIFWLISHRRGVRVRGAVPRKFQWRFSIPLSGVLLILADYLYFYALSLPNTPISQVDLVRRCSVVIAFTAGAYYFHDKNVAAKGGALAVILLGVTLLAWWH